MKIRIIKISIIICLCFSIFLLVAILYSNNKNKKGDELYNEINSINNTNKTTNEKANKYETNVLSKAERQAESLEYYYKQENKSNRLEIKATTIESILQSYLDEYKYNALNFPIDAYNSLDKEFREMRFGSLEKYIEFVNENKEQIKNITLDKYSEYNKDNYKEYICLDKNNKYYIFYIYSPGNYSLFLDNYTVDLPEFTEQYSNASDQRKVALNITKINSAINNQDYKYVYSKLADSFKNNYFENEDKLREYIINNLYKKSTLQLLDFAREGNYYTYKIRVIKEYEEGEEIPFGKNEPSKNVNIVMQLKEGTDFVMSFSIDE